MDIYIYRDEVDIYKYIYIMRNKYLDKENIYIVIYIWYKDSQIFI